MSVTKLIVIRHGNTFSAGESPRRVGARTDLDLVESHRGTSVGRYLKETSQLPDAVYSGPLKRHIQTASQALEGADIKREIKILHNFNEIDYGPDENKEESEVIARLGQSVIDEWNNNAAVPDGWDVDPDAIIKDWLDFANTVKNNHKGETVAIFSSNGTIRFAPHITGDFDGFCKKHDIKVPTGGVCIFELDEDSDKWNCTEWGIKPYKIYDKN